MSDAGLTVLDETDGDPSFDDWSPFAGWSSPAIKQYQGTSTSCGFGKFHVTSPHANTIHSHGSFCLHRSYPVQVSISIGIRTDHVSRGRSAGLKPSITLALWRPKNKRLSLVQVFHSLTGWKSSVRKKKVADQSAVCASLACSLTHAPHRHHLIISHHITCLCW